MDINKAAAKLKELFDLDGPIWIITHIDTDGISAGAIIVKMLKQHDQFFWLSTVKQLEDSYLDYIEKRLAKKKCKALLFLDLGAGKMDRMAKLAKITKVFVLDHHQINGNVNDFDNSVCFIHSNELSAAGICYFFAKELGLNKKDAQLAILGMIGDILDRNISRTSSVLIAEAQKGGMKSKKSLTFFSATRPLHKALEFSSNIFVPGVTGNSSGALRLLKEAGIEIKKAKSWRTLVDLDEKEMSRLITTILLRKADSNSSHDRIINNVYLIKIASQLWDGKELSTMLNACGRLGHAGIGIAFLLGSKEAKEEIQHVYLKYRHHLIAALRWGENAEKIQGQGYVIINAKSAVKDTMIGTVLSILANSFIYSAGTILIGLAYGQEKIKISARVVRSKNSSNETAVNLGQLLFSIVKAVGGETGGHAFAAGALILKEKEDAFLELIKQELSMQEIKVRIK